MLEAIYPYIAVTLALSIIWWFYRIYKNPNGSTLLPNISFFGSTVLYAITIFLTDFSFYYKLLTMLPRDLIAFVVVFFLANNLKSTRAFFLTAMGVGIGGYLLYSNFIEKSYQQFFNTSNSVNTETGLASNAELLFDIKDENLLGDIEKQMAKYQIKIKEAFTELKHNEYSDLDEYYSLDIPENSPYTLDEITQVLYSTKAVDWVEQNEIIVLSPLESKEIRGKRRKIDYGINDPNLEQMWGFEKMEVDAFYKYLNQKAIKPKKKAKIAILDTGVDSEHEDLKDNYTSTKKNYDKDKQSHGTHCAGIAAAVSNNGLGGASFALNKAFVEVTSIKVLSDMGWGTQEDIINGIIEAADKGADVISMSLGGPSSDQSQRAYEEAIKYANKAGAIVVVAAGNSNDNASKHSPANCKGVITVSAINENMEKAGFSNYISDLKMGIAAPGEDILSTIPKNKYASYSGTSMATPYVAGLLGIMKSLKPDLNTKQAYNLLNEGGLDTKDLKKTGKLIHPLHTIQKLGY